MSDETPLPIAEVIKCLEGARAHLKKHGQAMQDNQRGLTLGIAIVLTVLPDNLAKQVAAELAAPGKGFMTWIDSVESSVGKYAEEGGFSSDPDKLDEMIAGLKKLANQ